MIFRYFKLQKITCDQILWSERMRKKRYSSETIVTYSNITHVGHVPDTFSFIFPTNELPTILSFQLFLRHFSHSSPLSCVRQRVPMLRNDSKEILSLSFLLLLLKLTEHVIVAGSPNEKCIARRRRRRPVFFYSLFDYVTR